MTKITKWAGVLLILSALVIMYSCDTEGDDGGLGADFDETQYYTKTEVDALIAGAITQAVSDATPDQYTTNAVAADGPGKVLTGADYANRVGPWTVPSGTNFGIFNVEISGAVGDGSTYIYIGASDTQYEQYPLTANIVAFDVTVPTYGSSELYAWSNDPSAGAGFDFIIRYWLK